MVNWLLTRIPSDQIQFANSYGYADGAGAQVQRILSLLALAKKYDIAFYLNPIKSVEIQPLDYFNNEEQLGKNIHQVNEWLSNNFGSRLITNCTSIQNVSGPVQLIRSLFSIYLRNRLGIHVGCTRLTLLDSYFYLRVYPATWELLRKEKSQSTIKRENEKTVHIHLRLSTFTQSSDRKVTMAYYENILRELYLRAKLENFVLKVLIHTDFLGTPSENTFFMNHAVPESLKYWVDLGILQKDYSINDDLIDGARSSLEKFLGSYPGSTIFSDTSWISEWASMASGDFLIVSKSSFSLVGGILNASGVVFAPKDWSLRIPGWVSVD